MKIRTKFISIVCMIIILIAVDSMFLIVSTRQNVEDNMLEWNKNDISLFVLQQARNHIDKALFYEQDLEKTQTAFQKFFKEIKTDEIIRIKVWNAHARIIAADSKENIGMLFPEDENYQKALKGEVCAEITRTEKRENKKEFAYGQVMELYVPIRYADGKVAGVIETYTSLERLNNKINGAQKKLIMHILIPTLLVIGIIIVVFIILYGQISKPIRELKKFTKTIGEGNFNQSIIFASHDELTELAVSINKMVETLQETTFSKKALEKQIAERTKELQVKVEELEKFQKLTIGRELKMIELKKQIKELERKKNKGGKR